MTNRALGVTGPRSALHLHCERLKVGIDGVCWGITRHCIMRSCSAASRRAADHALICGIRRAQHVQRIMPMLMLPAHATRELSLHRILLSGHPARPPQLARTITGPGSIGFELLGDDADQRGARSGCEEAATPQRGLPTCRSELAQQVRDGCQFLAEEEAQLQASCGRAPKEGVDDLGSGGHSTEASSSIVSTKQRQPIKSHTVAL